MKLWVKVVCIFLLALFFILNVISFADWVLSLAALSTAYLKEALFGIIMTFLRSYLLPCVFCGLAIYYILKKSPEFKYEYQYYIEQKQAKKKQKLQEKLDKMEKGE